MNDTEITLLFILYFCVGALLHVRRGEPWRAASTFFIGGWPLIVLLESLED